MDSKTPLIFLPGYMCDSRLFGPQLEHFSPERDVRVAVPSPQAGSLEDMAQETLAAAPDRFALAGVSMGAIIAMEILRVAPDRVTRLVLMDANPRADTPEISAARERHFKEVQEQGLLQTMRRNHFPNYLAEGVQLPALQALFEDMASNLGIAAFLNHGKALQKRRDRCEDLKRITAPTLILCGAGDRVCPPAQHVMMQQLVAGSKLQIISDCGHLPMLEQPQLTTDVLVDWLL